jgi:hypothetical protein
MNCLTFEQMMGYLDGELTLAERKEADAHLEQCADCRVQLEDHRRLIAFYDEASFGGEEADMKLSEAFTGKVMDGISRRKADAPQDHSRLFREPRRFPVWTKACAAVLLVLALLSFSSYVSPTFASGMRSLFEFFQWDKGAKEAARGGFTVPVDYSVTDQGITLRAKEVLADPFRISVVYGLEQNGEPLDAVAIEDGVLPADPAKEVGTTKVYVTDEQGNRLRQYMNMANRGMDGAVQLFIQNPLGKDSLGKEEIDTLEDIPDRIIVHFDVSVINEAKGSWKLEVPIDLTKSKANSRIIPVHQSFTSEEGVTVELEQLRLGPSASAVYINTSETPAWKENSLKRFDKEDMNKNYHTWFYQVKDEKGRIVGASDGTYIGAYQLEDKNIFTAGVTGTNKKSQDLFNPFSKAESLTFEFKALYTREPADLRMTFDAGKISEAPFKTLYKGKTLTVTKVWHKDDPGPADLPVAIGTARLEGTGMVVEMDVELGKDALGFLRWTAEGFHGSHKVMEEYTTLSKNKDGSYKAHTWFFFKNDSTLGELTLSSDLIEKRTPVDWKVTVPVK